MSTVRDHVERYVSFKRELGYKFTESARLLRVFADYAMAHGDRFTRSDRMVDWAADAPSPVSMHDRLSAVRVFATWLHAEDERHEVPPRDIPSPNAIRRPPPRLMTCDEISQVMQAALSLGPAGSISPYTYHYMIGLLAVTGMRRSEALNLRLSDVTADGLVVRETKFRKSRLVPLHDSTREALDRYLEIRMRHAGVGDHLFIVSTGRPPYPSNVTDTFIRLARQVGLRGGPGERGPRLHDLRHSFCVRSLEAAVAAGRNEVNRHALALTTYVGHSKVSSTYWYLEATPTLLRQIAQSAESAHMGRVSR